MFYFKFFKGALIVAILNIQIPQVMGGVINVIAEFQDADKFLESVKEPAIRLTAMYVAQVFKYRWLINEGVDFCCVCNV